MKKDLQKLCRTDLYDFSGTKRPVVGYTTIDFNKTSALIKSSNNR